MNVACPECGSQFRVDPAKIPEAGVRARCSVCGGIISLTREPAAAGVGGAGAGGVGGYDAGSASEYAPQHEPDADIAPQPDDRSDSPAGAERAGMASAPAPTSGYMASRPTPPGVPAARAFDRSAGVSSEPFTPLSSPQAPDTPAGDPFAAPADAAPPAARSTPPFGGAAVAGDERAATPQTGAAQPSPAPRRPINPFLNNDPGMKAKRLARALVSDMVTYQPQKREEGLRNGTLKQLFREEIKKSYEEYVEQVGREVAESTVHFQDALNDILANGRKVF
jgi:predicted Zn finger-like uncharacterized protein